MIDTLPINESEYQLWEELTYSQNWGTLPNFGQAPNFETGCELFDRSEMVLLRFPTVGKSPKFFSDISGVPSRPAETMDLRLFRQFLLKSGAQKCVPGGLGITYILYNGITCQLWRCDAVRHHLHLWFSHGKASIYQVAISCTSWVSSSQVVIEIPWFHGLIDSCWGHVSSSCPCGSCCGG